MKSTRLKTSQVFVFKYRLSFLDIVYLLFTNWIYRVFLTVLQDPNPYILSVFRHISITPFLYTDWHFENSNNLNTQIIFQNISYDYTWRFLSARNLMQFILNQNICKGFRLNWPLQVYKFKWRLVMAKMEKREHVVNNFLCNYFEFYMELHHFRIF